MPTMRCLLLVAFATALSVSAADLEADLKAGEALLDTLPQFAEGPLKTVFFESLRSGKPDGYAVISLAAVKNDGLMTLEYESHGASRYGSSFVTGNSKAVMDPRFCLRAAALYFTTQMNPEVEVEKTDEEIVVENGRIRARKAPAEEWKEFPLGHVTAVWPTAELLKWVKFGNVNSFAFRELAPNGRW
jgi:hypothetical protein